MVPHSSQIHSVLLLYTIFAQKASINFVEMKWPLANASMEYKNRAPTK